MLQRSCVHKIRGKMSSYTSGSLSLMLKTDVKCHFCTHYMKIIKLLIIHMENCMILYYRK